MHHVRLAIVAKWFSSHFFSSLKNMSLQLLASLIYVVTIITVMQPTGNVPLNKPPTESNPMSEAELKTLAKLSRCGWKALATIEDIEDAEAVKAILVQVLEGIDRIEEQATE